VAVALLAVGLVATLSRQAWLGALVGLVLLFRERGRVRALVTVVCLALVVALLPIPDGSGRTFGDYLLSSGDTQTKSTAQRIGLWQQAIDATERNPVLGVGPGLVSTLNPDTTNKVFYAHNAVLDAAVETGIPGAIAFVALLLGGLALAWRNRSRVALGLIAAYAVANMFDDVLYFPRNGTFMAAAFALAALSPAVAAARSGSAGRSTRALGATPAAPGGGPVSRRSSVPSAATAPREPVAAAHEPVAFAHEPVSAPGPGPAAAAPAPASARVTPLVLGKGWFPDQEGGLNRYLRNLLDALGHPPAVVVGPARDAPRSVRARSEHDSPLARRILSFTATTLRRARGADVVDAHFALYAFLPTVLGLRGKPLVVHFHGPWGDESIVAGRAGRAKAAAQRAIERAVFRRAGAAVVLSEAFKELLSKRYGVDPRKIHVVRPGVDLERFSPGDREAALSRLGIPPGRAVAVTARRLVPRMGIDVLLDAWSKLGPDTRPLLLVVGDGQQRAELEARAHALGIDEDVRFLGKVSDDDLVAAYRAADVAVAPSIALEGFGLVTLEALACGTPTIASRVGGLPEALDPLDPSLVVAPKDAKGLASRLRGAFDGTAPLPSRERCREYAATFTWERTAREVESIYAEAAAAAPGERSVTR
jgi:glycosyltransferase involved in cell wall biosynthesis